MKLVLTVVAEADTVEAAVSEYEAIEEHWVIAAAKLDGKDFHPSLVEENEEATG